MNKQKSIINQFNGRYDGAMSYLNWFYADNLNMKSYQNYQEIGNKTWYSGDSAMIRAFFTRAFGSMRGFQPMQNSFWRNVGGNVSLVHLPIASSISETMSNVLFGRMPQIKANTSNKANNKKIDSKLESIFNFNNISSSLQQASQLESYSGTCVGKVFIDKDFDKPIIQWFPSEYVEEHSKFGKVVEVAFKDYLYDCDSNKYELKTICGYGYIRYELWEDKEHKLVPLSALEDTKGLKDIFFTDENGEPINVLMCVFKQNRVANNMFPTSKGDSDYTGLWTIFDSIDETASAMVDNIKKSRTYTFIPQKMLVKDEFGNVDVNKAYGIDVWDVKGNSETEKLPQRDYVPISVEPYISAIRSLTKIALNRVGLSPTTFGLDDSGANASGEALNIRDSRTEKTFKDKSQLWKNALEHLAKLLLIFDYVKANNTYVIPSNILNVEFNATFPPYREISPQDKFAKWVEMIDNSAMSVDYAMDDALRGEIPDADIEKIKEQLGYGNTDQEEVIEPTRVEEDVEEPIE